MKSRLTVTGHGVIQPMFLYLIGILLALALAALLWQQRKSSKNWQRQFTFFVDLLALSATALIVGVLAMVQLATPPGAATAGESGLSTPANATVEPLPEPEIALEPTIENPDEGEATPTARPTRTPTSEASPEVTVETSVEVNATAEISATIEVTTEPESTETSASPTRTPRATATPRATVTPKPTSTPEPTATPEPTPTVAPTATVGNRVHRVQSGDTLLEIAAQYNVTAAAILAANPGINADSLRIGQELIIPAPGSAPPPPPAPTTTTYTVREGDTLGAIAARLGTTVATLQRLNPNVDPARLRIGQVLVVPL